MLLTVFVVKLVRRLGNCAIVARSGGAHFGGGGHGLAPGRKETARIGARSCRRAGAMITFPKLAADALGAFLATDMKDRFGVSHARLAEIIPFAAQLALECIGNSDALYHNVEHTMLVTLAGHDIFKGRALVRGLDAVRLFPFHRRLPAARHRLRAGNRQRGRGGRFVVDAAGKKGRGASGASDAALAALSCRAVEAVRAGAAVEDRRARRVARSRAPSSRRAFPTRRSPRTRASARKRGCCGPPT